MAYNINDVYKIVLYAVSKNLQQGYVSPEDFNNSINIAQKGYVAYLLGNFQQYQPRLFTKRGCLLMVAGIPPTQAQPHKFQATEVTFRPMQCGALTDTRE